LSNTSSPTYSARSGIAEERDGRAVAGVDHHALLGLDVAERAGHHQVEHVLQPHLLGDVAARVVDDVDEQDAADSRAAGLFHCLSLAHARQHAFHAAHHACEIPALHHLSSFSASARTG
jgi:hypothetical protein